METLWIFSSVFFFFFNDTATTEIYTLSLHDALPISRSIRSCVAPRISRCSISRCLLFTSARSEEHTSELQSLRHLVCRLLLEKKNRTLRRSNNQYVPSSAQAPRR